MTPEEFAQELRRRVQELNEFARSNAPLGVGFEYITHGKILVNGANNESLRVEIKQDL